MTFACFSTANVYYRPFSELQKRPPLALQITTRSVIAIHYGKYGKLFESPKDQLMLNNAEDIEDIRKAENAGDGKNIEDAGNIGIARDKEDIKDAREKKTRRENDGAANRRD